MGEGGDVFGPQGVPEFGQIGRQVGAVAQAGGAVGVPDAGTEDAVEASDAQAGDFDDAAMQGAGGGAGVERRVRQVGPHFRAAIVVVITGDPEDVDATRQQRGGEHVKRGGAFNVPHQHRRLWQMLQSGEAAFDAEPVAMNVTDEDDVWVWAHFSIAAPWRGAMQLRSVTATEET